MPSSRNVLFNPNELIFFFVNLCFTCAAVDWDPRVSQGAAAKSRKPAGEDSHTPYEGTNTELGWGASSLKWNQVWASDARWRLRMMHRSTQFCIDASFFVLFFKIFFILSFEVHTLLNISFKLLEGLPIAVLWCLFEFFLKCEDHSLNHLLGM